ncbi:hypothetical protein GCK72_023757 [Caenorhabditis remanei]|uniref:Uncharacterized protein n=2 Tax=Caenorhabditis remanei TaxID=31234 RepID=A0A6A5FXP3_CAERE|nr:hypothetical protein GCK72_023757 [Caenorhabditis remanei]KAF1747295.1 hypothetical protein GCK72_023757 [Caenorhabditis remanei]
MLRKLLLALFIVISAEAWTNEQLIESVEKTCPPTVYKCPKPEYILFKSKSWSWNEQAVKNAPTAELFRRARHLNEQVADLLRDTYCCSEGPCLALCNIFEKKEIDLINDFPANGQDLLDLHLAELEPHREFIEAWLRSPNEYPDSRGRVPAELEELFDDIHKHQHLIRRKLREQKLRKQQIF